MNLEPEIPLPRIAGFVRQHTHDLRNSLNSLDLETSFLQEIVTDEEGLAAVGRVRRQLRALAENLRSLATTFQEPQPIAAPLAASELLLIWKEKHAALAEPPEIRWVDETGGARVNVDAELMAGVLRELLVNAGAFSRGQKLTASARAEGGRVIFELSEPKSAGLDASRWGEPFATTRRGGYGLGLWTAQRVVRAHDGEISRRYDPASGLLTTRISLAAD